MQLVEEATEGCWIGHRARMFTSEIGSVYSPPKPDRGAVMSPQTTKLVETVIDIDRGDPVNGEIYPLRECLLIDSHRDGLSSVRRVAYDAYS